MIYEERYAANPEYVKQLDTDGLRKEFLIQNLFRDDEIYLVYTHYDRYMAGGIKPVSKALSLSTIDPLKAENFLDRRELGVINVGGSAIITADGEEYKVDCKEALYLGKGNKEVSFKSIDSNNPALLYVNSAPAHHSYPNKKVGFSEAETVELGTAATSNARKINKLIVNSVVETCQLQMGMTQLKEGSVWNTMPSHTHNRRMEVYFYLDVPADQTVCHFMGQPQETRHVFMQNHEAVISPPWSIHSGCGTSNYTFIWGMAGENLDYGDMDTVQPNELR